MNIMTIDELRNILMEAAGADESIDLAGEIIDRDFADLGYDSLALLETAAVIQRRYSVTLSDEEVTESRTPREVLDAVNSALVKAE
jgi:minimal PKS acyl carrier protein